MLRIGLSEKHMANYQKRIEKLGEIQYLIDKYGKIDYESLLNYYTQKRFINKPFIKKARC
ncbi:hypothetical protein ACINWC743_3135 [Acinetobacter sp. WC-743]|nr:hypothetical protein ACINWC743_3135 [Acinetobacter sp. WC-743]